MMHGTTENKNKKTRKEFAILQISFYAHVKNRDFFKEGLVDQRFNLLAWKALCAVENTGSITDAAAELRTDPSTVSRLIAHLEAALGQTLVRRTERPAMMTPIGREIAKKAEPVLNAHAAFLARIANDTGTMAGTIRLYVDPNIIDDALMSILTDFQALYPEVSFQITTGSTISDCLSGAVDVLVVPEKPQEKGLYCLAQGRCVFIPVASRAYLKKHLKPIKPEDLIEHTGFIYGKSSAEQSQSLHHQGLTCHVRYKNTIVTSDILAIKKAVLKGHGVTASLPLFYCASEIAAGQLDVTLEGWHRPPMPVFCLCSSSGWHTRRIRVFIQWWVKRLVAEFENKESLAQSILGNRFARYTEA